jgi:hypothetical protein
MGLRMPFLRLVSTIEAQTRNLKRQESALQTYPAYHLRSALIVCTIE